MRLTTSIAAIACAACAAVVERAAPAESSAPLGAEGEVRVYLAPLPGEAESLAFTLERVALRPREGAEVVLRLEGPEVTRGGGGQRLLAWARVPPGEYAGLAFTAAAASSGRDGERGARVVEPREARAELSFRVRAGESVVLWAALDPARALPDDVRFTPALGVLRPPQTPPQVALYCTSPDEAGVTVADRRARLVTGFVPTGGRPRGIALDRLAARAYVALEDEDAVEVLDLAGAVRLDRLRMTPGDGPREVGVTAEGTLAVVNARSRTLAFLDPAGRGELARVPLGDAPGLLLLDLERRRAYVANAASGGVTVVDTGRRALAATLPTEREPVALALSRGGDRLYVAHRGSPRLLAFELPSLAPLPGVHVGLGATALLVDQRTDLLYLARADGSVSVHDPLALQELERLVLPGPATRLAIDDAEDALLALVPSRRAIVAVDLTSRAPLGEVPVGGAPHQLAFQGERR